METQTKQTQQREKGVYMNPITDFGFKYIFEDDGILKPFIEDVLGIKIKQLEYLNSEELGQSPEEKKVIYDLLCKDGDGNEFIVEMQNGEQVFFSDRIVYYLSKRISSGIKKGENESWKYGLAPVYGIFILNFHLHGLKPSAVRTIRLKVEETGETFNHKVTAYTLELPDYRTRAVTEQYTDTEMWIYNIANLDKMKGDLPFTERQPAFKRLQEKARRGNLTPKEEVEYERSLKIYRDNNACLHFAQTIGMEEGRAKGIEIGKAEGFAEGKAEGKAEGRAEGRAQGRLEAFSEIVKNARSKGKTIDEIADITDLTPEQIAEF